MREKLFPQEKVEKYLEKYKQSGESLLKEEYLIRKINNLLQKGKSRQYIFQKLGETSEDKTLLKNIFETHFSDGEDESLKKEYEKVRYTIERKYAALRSSERKQKIIQKLIAKGFCYDDIKKVINNLQ